MKKGEWGKRKEGDKICGEGGRKNEARGGGKGRLDLYCAGLPLGVEN